MSSIRVDYDILNQKQTPAFYASSLATRPAFGFPGRIFIDTDTPSSGIYRDTGSAWIQVADPGAGTTGTLQQVTTNGSSTTIGLSTSGNGIGIGTTIPASNKLDIHSASGINATFNGTTTNNAALQLQNAGTGKWNIQNLYNAGANSFQVYDVLNSTARLTILNTGAATFSSSVTINGNIANALDVLGSIRTDGASNGIDLRNGFTATISNPNNNTRDIRFDQDTTGTVMFKANGNVLIGTTTDSGYKLDVNGTGRFSGALTGTSATFSSSATATAFIPSGATVPTNGMYLSAANTLNFATASTNRLSIGSTGNTLITGRLDCGSTNSFIWSASFLEVKDAIRIFDSSSSSYGLRFGFNSNVPFIQGFRETVGVIDLLLQNSGGNVGISTTTIGSKLQVNGNVAIGYSASTAASSNGLQVNGRGNFLNATDNALFSLNSGGTLYTVGFSPNATASSTNTLTLTTGQTTWIYTGTGVATWTLPTPSGTNQMFWIKNAGTGVITLNAFAGTNIINNSATSVSSITIAVGATALIQQDGNVKSYQLQ